jgi:glutathione S-transferase
MSRLFISPGACSFGAHVLVNILNAGHGQSIEVVKVALRQADSPIHKINPKGKVPAFALDDGAILTENGAILPYLGDLVPEAGLFAPFGSFERARIQEWIGFANSELHPSFRPVTRPEFYDPDPASHAALRRQGLRYLEKLLTFVDERLPSAGFLFGDGLSIADAYLGYFLSNVPRAGIAAGRFPAIEAYAVRYGQQEAVRAARAFEAVA